MSLTAAHSLWLAPLCIALGVGYAWLLYSGSEERHGWSKGLQRAMAVLRAVVVAVLAFFLLEPMVRVLLREVRKPVVVLAHDGSSSLLAAGDTNALRSTYRAALEELTEKLGDAYEVRPFTYADELSEGLSFDQRGARTDIDRLFRDVYDRFAGADLGAVIVDGDGIYNRGRDPLLAAEHLGVPVFTIALGDTTVHPDVVLRDVEHNRVTYLGNAFPVMARVHAHHLAGTVTRVSITHKGKEVAAKDVAITSDPFATETPLMVKAEAPGVQRYTVSVRPVEGEVGTTNNSRSIIIDVLDDRKKVLLLAEAPHPDVAAVRRALDAVEGYATTVAYANGFNEKVEEYDLVVLHQLPSVSGALAPVLQRLAQQDIPTWTILGGRTALDALQGTGIQVQGGQRTFIDAQPVVAEQSLFTLDPDDTRAYERFPPLQVPFGQYALGRGAVAVMTQRIGMVPTEYPLLAIQAQGERRAAVICGEGLWRWRLADLQLNGSSVHFDKLVQRVAQYLALDQEKDRFRVTHPLEFAQGDPVQLQAELYNASYQPVNQPEVGIRLKNENGQELAYTFSPVGTGYRLDAGTLEPGRYAWTATVSLDGQRLTDSGELTVDPLVTERLTTVADHALWAKLAARTQGEHVGPDGVARIPELLAQRKTLLPRSYAHAGFSDLIGLRWIFFLLLALLTLEWVLRRRNGAY